MRKQFVKTTEDILKNDEAVVLILGDISIYGFRNSFKEFPDRVYNIGVLEQSTISIAAGLAIQGLIPIVHTIAPFLVERPLEQIKNDFGYQHLGGNLVSIGASYDYAALGGTHHCPADVGILKNVPGIEILVPGTAEEFDKLFRQTYKNGKPTYFRLTEKSNQKSHNVEFGKANVVKIGKKATIVVVGPMLDKISEACDNLDVTIIYYTTLQPFDKKTLKENLSGGSIVICEPYYSGALTSDITEVSGNSKILHIGMPREFIHNYGKTEEIDKKLELETESIKKKIENFI